MKYQLTKSIFNLKTKKMKKINLFSILIAIAMVVTVSCNKDEEPYLEGDTLSGNYTDDVTLESGKTYKVKGDAIIKNGATLTIEKGVTIEGMSEFISYILIEQGAKIMAEGTADEPIIMTADKKETGSWGGLHICGKAPINKTGGTGESEIGGAAYGGTDAADNSGIVRYVRLEYTGVALDDEHESNGISMYGVGSGTTIEYVQVYEGADDGIEFFGGTVNVKYIMVTGALDDCIDWTEGWSGKGQYMVAKQTGAGDRGIEGDNNGSNNTATPYASPTLSQVTLIGNGDADNYGMKLREGTKGKFVNLVVTGFDKRTIHVEHNQTLLNVADGSLDVDYAYIDTNVTDHPIKYSVSKVDNPDYDPNDPDSEPEIDDPSQEAADAKADAKANAFELSSNLVLTTVAADASKTYDGGIDAATLDAFFTSDSKIGAGTSWASGWTK